MWGIVDGHEPLRAEGTVTAPSRSLDVAEPVHHKWYAKRPLVIGELGIAEDTIVIFTADNGPQFAR